jgi:Obg family GTPase CgtA-like protein
VTQLADRTAYIVRFCRAWNADALNHGHVFSIEQRGKQIEKLVQMTNWDYYEALDRFQRILDATGINAALKKRGAREGALALYD